MKIIDRHKDIYDYLTGVYGEDPLIVLDRRQKGDLGHLFLGQKLRLYIGGYYTEGLYLGNKDFAWGESLRDMDSYDSLEETYWKAKSKAKNKRDYYTTRFYNKADVDKAFRKLGENSKEDYVFIKGDASADIRECMYLSVWKKDPNNWNKKLNLSIFLEKVKTYDYTSPDSPPDPIAYPFLFQLDFKISTPEEIYLMIYNFLLEQNTLKESFPDTRTNLEKLESKGFDKITSFRSTK